MAEKIAKKEMENKIKEYSKEVSKRWKEETRKMLELAHNACEPAEEGRQDREDARQAFMVAVSEMVGNRGSVARTVPKENLESFAETIFENYPKIKEGKILKEDVFDIFSVKYDNSKDKNPVKDNESKGKNPLSYITKICHIINPKGCPLIWDSKVREALKIKSKTQYKEVLINARNTVSEGNYSDEEIYDIESAIWAGIENDEIVNAFKSQIGIIE